MDYLLSIIIPTRDREKYCIACVEYMLTAFPPVVQFVIQDNSVSDLISNWNNEQRRMNVTYNHIYEPLSPIDNFNKAIDLARGKYIIFVGDDDIVLPNAFELVKWADVNSIDSIAQKRNLSYAWPNEGKSGLFVLPKVSDPNGIKRYDLRKCLIKYLKKGSCDNPRLFHLPSFYHGIIKKSVLERIKEDTGNYLGGLSSDSFSSTALSFYVTNHIEISKFFTLPGACPSSTTIANIHRDHCGDLKKAPHLKNRKNYKWHEMIPEYYSVQTIWSESVLQALKDTDNKDYYKYFSLEDEFAVAIVLNPTIRDLVVNKTSELLKDQNRLRTPFYFRGYLKAFNYYIMRNIKRAYVHFFSKEKVIHNIQIISDCISFIPREMLEVSYKDI